MADYQGKNVVIIGLGLTGLSCVDFFLARGVTPRVMDTRMTPPGLDKLPEAVERHTGSLNDEWPRGISAYSVRNNEVLPVPLFPIKYTNSPLSICKFTLLNKGSV